MILRARYLFLHHYPGCHNDTEKLRLALGPVPGIIIAGTRHALLIQQHL